jgi:hypothetical protein
MNAPQVTTFEAPVKVRLEFVDERTPVEFLATTVEVSDAEIYFRNDAQPGGHGRRRFRRSHVKTWDPVQAD